MAGRIHERKHTRLEYHIQEAMLAEHIAKAAPARVLEFGCGFGRHGICAISLAWTSTDTIRVRRCSKGCRSWADPAWIAAHVHLGPPTGKLPYPDQFFDIVYTAEVLVHVRPEDLNGVLSELLRVAKREVFDLEPGPDYGVDHVEHNGCWQHDLVAAYRSLGRTCDTLPKGYASHNPYRVRCDAAGNGAVWRQETLT